MDSILFLMWHEDYMAGSNMTFETQSLTVRIELMGRQTQLHVLPKDLNELLVAMHDREPLEVALRSGSAGYVPPFAPCTPANFLLRLTPCH